MEMIFYVCLGVGMGYMIITLILGELTGLIDFDSFSNGVFSLLKPVCISTFLTVFGFTGVILLDRFIPIIVIFIAFILGVTVSNIINKFIIIPLHNAQNTSAVEIESLIGHDAKVTNTILQGKYGTITYSVNGNTYTSPAKSETGEYINVNECVEIVKIYKNTYYVRPKKYEELQ